MATPCGNPEAKAKPTKKRLREKQAEQHVSVAEIRQADPDVSKSDSETSDSSEDEEGDSDQDVIFEALATANPPKQTEQDAWNDAARRLSAFLRKRPTLPADAVNPFDSFSHLQLAIRLPLYSCPFLGCTFCTDTRLEFLRHLGSRNGPHSRDIDPLCRRFFSVASPLDFVYLAMAVIERDQVPAVGMATTRRSLRTLTTTYNDNSIQSLVCFVCASMFCTFAGPTGIDFSEQSEADIPARSEI